MLYARQPTDQEQEELKRMVRREVGRVSQRAQMVLLSIQRRKVAQIWLRLKDQIAANRLYGSIQLLMQAVEQFFDEMTPTTALTWASAKC
jgi:hypothetical protein